MKHTVLPVVCLLLLGACDITTPSQVNIGQIRLEETMRTEVLNGFGGIDTARVNILADDYQRNGAGPIRMVFSYDEAKGKRELTRAQKQGDLYKTAFSHRGVADLDIDYVSVTNKDDAGRAIVSYGVMAALPPSGCTVPMPGSDGSGQVEDMLDYQISCETQTALSKMVSHPQDLMGRAGTPDGDSKRQGSLVEKYRAGEKNDPIKGFDASEIGSKETGAAAE